MAENGWYYWWPSLYNVEGVNRLLPGLQPQPTESVLNICFVLSDSAIVFSIPEIILLSSAKQHIQVINILE
jgi:hypothetical protein